MYKLAKKISFLAVIAVLFTACSTNEVKFEATSFEEQYFDKADLTFEYASQLFDITFVPNQKEYNDSVQLLSNSDICHGKTELGSFALIDGDCHMLVDLPIVEGSSKDKRVDFVFKLKNEGVEKIDSRIFEKSLNTLELGTSYKELFFTSYLQNVLKENETLLSTSKNGEKFEALIEIEGTDDRGEEIEKTKIKKVYDLVASSGAKFEIKEIGDETLEKESFLSKDAVVEFIMEQDEVVEEIDLEGEKLKIAESYESDNFALYYLKNENNLLRFVVFYNKEKKSNFVHNDISIYYESEEMKEKYVYLKEKTQDNKEECSELRLKRNLFDIEEGKLVSAYTEELWGKSNEWGFQSIEINDKKVALYFEDDCLKDDYFVAKLPSDEYFGKLLIYEGDQFFVLEKFGTFKKGQKIKLTESDILKNVDSDKIYFHIDEKEFILEKE